MITLRQLIEAVRESDSFNHVIDHVIDIHKEWQLQSRDKLHHVYTRVCDELLDLPGDPELSGYSMVIPVDDTSHVHLCNSETTYALDLVDWNELIDLPVKDSVCTRLSQRLAVILYEITFWGFNRASVLEQAETLKQVSHDQENMIEMTLEQFLSGDC